MSPLPLVIKVRGKTQSGETREAARSLPLRLYGDLNENPAIRSIGIGDGELTFPNVFEGSCTRVGPFVPELDEIPLTLQLDDGRFEDYSSFDGVECLARRESEDFTVAWYTSLGDLERGIGGSGSIENTLMFEPPSSTSRIYMVARDGRGGLAVQCIQMDIEQAPPEMP